jgi:hypothetical protein
MAIRPFTVTLVGATELLMDRDNITFAERLTRWHKDPLNADKQSPGDDRAPAWGWLGKLHYSEADNLVGIPQGMLSACLRAAATMIPHPTAKGKKSLKEVSQAGIAFTQTCFPLLVHLPGQPGWHPIPYDDLYTKLAEDEDFDVQVDTARMLGIRIDVRRSRPQFNRSHVRVRPMFAPWRCVCQMSLMDDALTEAVTLQMFRTAGIYKGMGNWRPSAGRAGSYGTFEVLEGIPDDMQPGPSTR